MNNRDRNFTKAKIASRLAHLETEVGRYIEEADRIDRQETGAARAERAAPLKGRYHGIRQQIERLLAMEKALDDAPGGQISLTDPDARAPIARKWQRARSTAVTSAIMCRPLLTPRRILP